MGEEETEDDLGRPVIIFGRDIRKIPCFRDSYLYAISSGIGVMLVTFMLTSRGQLAAHCGMGTFFTVSLGYFAHCRYQYARDKFAFAQIQSAVARAAVLEGTDEDPRLKPSKDSPKIEVAEA